MRPTFAVLASLIATASLPASAQGTVSLERLAHRDGYAMQWLGPERSVCLSRDGTVIVIRPGSQLYDVNAHVEIADSAPLATDAGDMLVSPAFARRLTALARINRVDRGPGRAAPARTISGQGTIVVIARELEGRHALLVQGSAPQNARITLTLLAQIAPELPTVLLDRSETQSDIDGRFSAVVPLSPDYMPGSLVTLYATGDGLSSASTHLQLDGAL